jgi:integrase
MYSESMDNDDDDRRVWLNSQEMQKLKEHYSDAPIRELCVRLMSHGLRRGEAVNVRASDIDSRGSDGEQYDVVTVRNGKTGDRVVPIAEECAQLARTISNLNKVGSDECIVDVQARAASRWVTEACEELSESDGKDWGHVSTHDLRRSWATRTYWQLDSRALQTVLAWGVGRTCKRSKVTTSDRYFRELSANKQKQRALPDNTHTFELSSVRPLIYTTVIFFLIPIFSNSKIYKSGVYSSICR